MNHGNLAESLETISLMPLTSPHSTSLIIRRRQTVLSMIAAGLIGAALGLQIWSAHAGWFLAIVVGLGTALVTSGMISIALHGSLLFAATQGSSNSEAAAHPIQPNQSVDRLPQIRTDIASPKPQPGARSTRAIRRTRTTAVVRKPRQAQQLACAEPACV
jgi:hypothetical protein